VHCAHSYLDIAVLGPGQCTEPVCLDIRRSGLFKGKNVSAAGMPVPQCNLPLSSVEMFALMSSYKKDVGVEAMGGLSDVFSKGSEHVKTSVARVRGASRLCLSSVLGAVCCSAPAAPTSLRVYPPPAPPPPTLCPGQVLTCVDPPHGSQHQRLQLRAEPGTRVACG
jgi:hypothetical protein